MKKLIRYFVLVLLICSVLVVSASATTSSGDYPTTFSAGIPLDITYTNYDVGSTSVLGYTNLSNANVFNIGPVNTVTSSNTNAGVDVRYTFYKDSGIGVEDVAISLATSFDSRLSSYSIHDNISLVATSAELDYARNTIQLKYNSIVDNVYSIKVRREYEVVYATLNGSSSNMSIVTLSREEDIPINYTYDSNAQMYTARAFIPTFTNDDFNSIIAEFSSSERDYNTAIVRSVTGYIDGDLLPYEAFNNIYIIDEFGSSNSLNVILRKMRDTLAYLYRDFALDVSFDDLSWVDWLSNAVSSFMDFELVPGLSLAGILSIIIGIPILIWFLRLFAGG